MTGAIVLIALVLTLIVGLLFCLRGYKWLRIFIALYAFWMGTSRIYSLLSLYAASLGVTWTWIIALAAGLLLAILAFVFIRFAFFLAGGLLGIALYRLVAALNPVFFGSLTPLYSFLIGLLFFLLLGFAALAAKKFLLVAATSIWGAYTTVLSAGILIGLLVRPAVVPSAVMNLEALSPYSIFASAPLAVPLVIMAVLAVFGIIHQSRTTHAGGRRR